jgi:hypothetical protein
MNSAVLLAEENRQLQYENKRQKRKRAKKRAFIATRGILTVQEGLDRSQDTNIVPESGLPIQTRTPLGAVCYVIGGESVYVSRGCVGFT